MPNSKAVKKMITVMIVVILIFVTVFLLFFALALKCIYDDDYKNADGTFGERIQLAFGELMYEEPFDTLVKRMKYKYLGIAGNENIALGRDGFLFLQEKNGFSYEADFKGEEKISEEQME